MQAELSLSLCLSIAIARVGAGTNTIHGQGGSLLREEVLGLMGQIPLVDLVLGIVPGIVPGPGLGQKGFSGRSVAGKGDW